MNIQTLEKQLHILGIPEDMYSLEGGLPNEKLCIVQDGSWQVYYSERGCKSGLREFTTEEEACAYFFETIKSYVGI